MDGLPFRKVWAADFEYGVSNGGRPVPVCLVAKELRSGRLLRLWRDDLGARPPFPIDRHALFVTYNAVAELSCFLVLGWPMPERVLDLYVEFLARTNGIRRPQGTGLLAALSHHGLQGITSEEKQEGRSLALQGSWAAAERVALLDYCQTDVDALGPLLARMLPAILVRPKGLGHALLRGRYMAAVARMEHAGVPIDTDLLAQLRDGWDGIKLELIADIDRAYGVFEGTTFKRDRFERWLAVNRIPWPRTDKGNLALDRDTFKDQANAYPLVAPLRELRVSLGEMRLEKLAVGPDGRNRVSLFPFASKTGRNQPGNSRFIFGPATWLRGLIRPEPGRALAYLDWSSQEIAIAAALSGDQRLIDAIASGDPYLYFAKLAGLAPADATKQSHRQVRDLCKTCLLGTNYGMGAYSLAQRTGTSRIRAESTLRAVSRAFPTFWRWADHQVDVAVLSGRISTVFGWSMRVTSDTRPTTLRNYPMQAHGAEMMRLACSQATERGVIVCAPVHDALLIEAPADVLDQAVAQTTAAMLAASRHVLAGLEVAVDANRVIYPDRYMDDRGRVMWGRVMALLDRQRMAA